MNDKYLPNNQPQVICQVTKQTKNISFMLRLITEGRGSYDYAKNLGWKCLQKYWTAEIHKFLSQKTFHHRHLTEVMLCSLS